MGGRGGGGGSLSRRRPFFAMKYVAFAISAPLFLYLFSFIFMTFLVADFVFFCVFFFQIYLKNWIVSVDIQCL